MRYKVNLTKTQTTLILSLIYSCLFLLTLFSGGITPYGPYILEVIVFGTAILWFIWFSRKNYSIYFSKFYWLLLLFMVWCFFSAWLSDYVYFSLMRCKEWIAFSLLIFLSSQMYKDYSKYFSFQVVVVFFSLFQSIVGIIQFFGFNYSRAVGTFGTYANFYSHFIGVGFLIAMWWIFKSTIRRSRREKILIWVPAIIIGIALVLSGSRILVLMIIPLSLFANSWSRRIFIFIMAVILILGGFVIAHNYGGRNIFTGDPYHFARIEIWQQSIRLFRDNPITGYGPGSFIEVSHRENFPSGKGIVKYSKIAKYAHQNYLELAVETGIVGLLLMMLLFWGAIKNFFNSEIRLENNLKLVSILIMWFIIIGFFDTFMYPPSLEVVLALLLGMAIPVKEYRFSGRSGIRLKRFGLIFISLISFWTICSGVGGLLIHLALGEIKQGSPENVNQAKRILKVAKYLVPTHPDIYLLNSYVYEYYYLWSGNKTWLEFAYEQAEISAEDDYSPQRWHRLLQLAEQMNLRKEKNMILDKLIEIKPYDPTYFLKKAEIIDNIFQRESLLKRAYQLEPNFIGVAAELYRAGLMEDSVVIHWNFDSLLLLSENEQDTWLVSNYPSVNIISNILVLKGYSDSAIELWQRIFPIYGYDFKYVQAYVEFLTLKNFDIQLDKFLDTLNCYPQGPEFLDSLKRLDLI
ncbi:MAG: O-antigen ligase family protein [bacterium]